MLIIKLVDSVKSNKCRGKIEGCSRQITAWRQCLKWIFKQLNHKLNVCYWGDKDVEIHTAEYSIPHRYYSYAFKYSKLWIFIFFFSMSSQYIVAFLDWKASDVIWKLRGGDWFDLFLIFIFLFNLSQFIW